MWAHYAEGHSGVCLVFERENLATLTREAFDGRAPYAGNVMYADYASDEIDGFTLDGDRIEAEGLEPVIDDHFEAWHPVLFFRKNIDWADEFEFRWLLRGPDPAPEFVAIREALCGIVAGDSFPSREHDSLQHLATRLGSPTIATCQWNNGYPDLLPWVSGSYVNMQARFRATRGATPPPSLRVRSP